MILVNDRATLKRLKKALRGSVAFDIETTGLYPWHGDIVSVGLGTADEQYVIPWVHAEAKLNHKDVVEELDPIIQDCQLITQFGKFDALWMRVKHGVDWISSFDVGLAHYLIDENSPHDLEFIAKRYLGIEPWDVPLDIKQGKQGIAGKHAQYLSQDLRTTRALRFKLGPLLDQQPGLKRVFHHILMPCLRLFTEIEFNGVFIDKTKFDEAEEYLTGEIARTLAQLKQWQPPDVVIKRPKKDKIIEFNWGSPKQVGELLFDKLKIKCVEKTPTGRPSTSESTLKQIDHPLVESLLAHRGAKQQMSFFIDGWKPWLIGDYLHPSFKLHGTVTGRLSAEHPNLQQVPRDPRIRQLISAPPGWDLIEADLSQIELRIAAELADEAEMLYAFTHGIDVHWLTLLRELRRNMAMPELILDTAAAILGRRLNNYQDAVDALLKAGPDAATEFNSIWKELRKKAKAINFGFLYGMWWKKFRIYARDNYGVHVSADEAKESRESFFELYSDLPAWHRKQQRLARRHGYIETLSGRRRHLPDAMLKDDTPQRAEALRQAINSPVQSFANELNLMAALQLREEYPRSIVQICGTVHDAVIARVKRPHTVEVSERLLEIMRDPKLLKTFGIELGVPIEADLKIGPWSRGISLKKYKGQRK